MKLLRNLFNTNEKKHNVLILESSVRASKKVIICWIGRLQILKILNISSKYITQFLWQKSRDLSSIKAKELWKWSMQCSPDVAGVQIKFCVQISMRSPVLNSGSWGKFSIISLRKHPGNKLTAYKKHYISFMLFWKYCFVMKFLFTIQQTNSIWLHQNQEQ